MALPTLPALNSTDWYAWATAVHNAVNATAITVYRLVHDGTSYPARPSSSTVAAGYAEYVGPTTPTDALDGDTWIQRA